LPPESTWQPLNFLERFDEWVEREQPIDEQRIAVLAWIHHLRSDPYRNATPNPEHGLPWWFAEIPDSRAGVHRVVCSYRVDSTEQTVYCDNFATLRYP
jgi:hypothetical protein